MWVWVPACPCDTVWGGYHRSHFLQEALGCLTVWTLAIAEAHCSEKEDALGCAKGFGTLRS